jgi:outer membrane biosynthesis protein TonB
METIIILLIIVLIILYNSSVNSNRQALEKLQSRLDQLLRETTSLREEVKGLSTPKTETTSPIVKEPVKPQPKPEPPPQPVQPVVQPPVPQQPQKTERTYKEVPPPKYEPMHIIEEETWWQK